MSVVITQGADITLHFTLSLISGEVIDTTKGKNPARCVVGDGNFLPGFEVALMGLHAGQTHSCVIKAENGFGLRRDENIHVLPKIQFGKEAQLEEGLMMNFADGKATIPGVITSIQDDVVTVDFNHPLSGYDIIFSVDIIDVKAPQFVKVKAV